MADEDDDSRDEAPDLQILGDEVTFQPSGVKPGKDDTSEEALMKPLGRFRSHPLQYVSSVILLRLATANDPR